MGLVLTKSTGGGGAGIGSYFGSLYNARADCLGCIAHHADPTAHHADPAAHRLADGPEWVEGDALLSLGWSVVFARRPGQGFLFDQGFS